MGPCLSVAAVQSRRTRLAPFARCAGACSVGCSPLARSDGSFRPLAPLACPAPRGGGRAAGSLRGLTPSAGPVASPRCLAPLPRSVGSLRPLSRSSARPAGSLRCLAPWLAAAGSLQLGPRSRTCGTTRQLGREPSAPLPPIPLHPTQPSRRWGCDGVRQQRNRPLAMYQGPSRQWWETPSRQPGPPRDTWRVRAVKSRSHLASSRSEIANSPGEFAK